MLVMAEPAPTTSPLVRRYGIDEFFALDAPSDGGHWELIAGVLYMVPPPKSSHSLVLSRLNEQLVAFAISHPGVGRVFLPRAAVWARQPATYLEPDLFMVASAGVADIPEDGFRKADLVVEVLSPSTAVYDRTTKADTYAALGVGELWLVDPETRTIERRVHDGSRWGTPVTIVDPGVLESHVFPRLTVHLEVTFSDLRPQ